MCLLLALCLGVAANAAPERGGGGWSGGGGSHWSGGEGSHGSGGGSFEGSHGAPSVQSAPHPQGSGGGSSFRGGHEGFGTPSSPWLAPRGFEGDRHDFDFDRDRRHFRGFGDEGYFDFGFGGPWYDYSLPYACSNPVQCDSCRRAYDNGDTWYLERYCPGPYPPY